MATFFASTVGFGLSFAIVALLRPAIPAPWHWAGRGMALHAGIWLLLHAMLTLALGRPWFAMAIGLALLMLVIQVSNAKYHALKESFVFQDFEYFTDAIRHPRLYIPFLGWWKFAMIAVAVVGALVVGLWLEAPHAGVAAQVCWLLGLGCVLLVLFRHGSSPSWEPEADLVRQGLLACFWDYGWAERRPLSLTADKWAVARSSAECPDIVVVQSESFFDPRGLFAGIRSEVLGEFDALRRNAWLTGSLTVPAWGANTVRSEFAFLCGAPESELGVHRFNPYRGILRSPVASLVSRLKASGYRTVCIHPYPASFYQRHKVYPHLGFDEFIDIRGFVGAERCGPYISDAAVADCVAEVLAQAGQPVFIFVITMENHGPLHLEKAQPGDVADLYTEAPPAGCDDLTIYLRHLRNADRMAGKLYRMLLAHPRPARLGWYGDHVPIMPGVYRALGEPSGETEYLLWSNWESGAGQLKPMHLADLAQQLIAAR